MAAIIPFEDRVLIKKIEEDNMSPSGILFIPDTAEREPSQKAEVVAIGDGKVLDDGTLGNMYVEIGMLVWVGKYSGVEVKIDNEEFFLMRQADILGQLVE